MALLDINNKEIRIGDTVKSVHPDFGFIHNVPPATGIVEIAGPNGNLLLKYFKQGISYPCYLELEGKINEIISTE